MNTTTLLSKNRNGLLPQGIKALAVLVSGGLDSAVLLGEALSACPRVTPLYVRTGSAWETIERQYLNRYLASFDTPALQPLKEIALPVTDIYGDHWSLNGHNVPDEHSPDEAVFLPGRNVILLAKALIWCHLQGISAVAMAPLAANPFPDATPEFFADFAQVVSRAIAGQVEVLIPYAGLHKAEVIQRGKHFRLEATFSCIRPIDGLHCGRCNKCAERQKAFRDAGVPDPTRYATS